MCDYNVQSCKIKTQIWYNMDILLFEDTGVLHCLQLQLNLSFIQFANCIQHKLLNTFWIFITDAKIIPLHDMSRTCIILAWTIEEHNHALLPVSNLLGCLASSIQYCMLKQGIQVNSMPKQSYRLTSYNYQRPWGFVY